MSGKPGNPNWQKGKSGNPGGRPKIVAEVKELARAYTEEAVATLAAIMKDADQPAAARVSAASVILDRGYGKAPQHMTVARERNVDELTDAELQERIALALSRVEAITGGADAAGDGPVKPDRVH